MTAPPSPTSSRKRRRRPASLYRKICPPFHPLPLAMSIGCRTRFYVNTSSKIQCPPAYQALGLVRYACAGVVEQTANPIVVHYYARPDDVIPKGACVLVIGTFSFEFPTVIVNARHIRRIYDPGPKSSHIPCVSFDGYITSAVTVDRRSDLWTFRFQCTVYGPHETTLRCKMKRIGERANEVPTLYPNHRVTVFGVVSGFRRNLVNIDVTLFRCFLYPPDIDAGKPLYVQRKPGAAPAVIGLYYPADSRIDAHPSDAGHIPKGYYSHPIPTAIDEEKPSSTPPSFNLDCGRDASQVATCSSAGGPGMPQLAAPFTFASPDTGGFGFPDLLSPWTMTSSGFADSPSAFNAPPTATPLSLSGSMLFDLPGVAAAQNVLPFAAFDFPTFQSPTFATYGGTQTVYPATNQISLAPPLPSSDQPGNMFDPDISSLCGMNSGIVPLADPGGVPCYVPMQTVDSSSATSAVIGVLSTAGSPAPSPMPLLSIGPADDTRASNSDAYSASSSTPLPLDDDADDLLDTVEEEADPIIQERPTVSDPAGLMQSLADAGYDNDLPTAYAMWMEDGLQSGAACDELDSTDSTDIFDSVIV